ncbi:DUF2914 domain-containing protein [Catenovulum sp. SM1970]|uniref:DUF2914 domain-containing protein n=1 Tax=Marinifaba aquimaris TaxID=2741323 RepID=UPI00157223B0|nr:DUF2914 domain-containing protein [Marinifaba aquimaris]NTS76755.1 DUF2914 domain-containing protein [Marinifaba aquimaris]
MSKQQLKIQIKLKNSAPEQVKEEVKPPFSKSKISAALLFVGASLTGLVHAFNTEEPTLAATGVALSSVDAPAPARASLTESVSAQATEEAATEVEAVVEQMTDAQVETAVATEQTQAVMTEQLALEVEEIATNVDAEVVNVTDAVAATTDEVSVTTDKATDAGVIEVATLEKPESFDKKPVDPIKRLVLTRKIKDKEPSGEEEKRIPSQSNTFVLFLFTELEGYQGDFITHKWIFRDKVMAETKLEIGDDAHWRTWSSKRILWKWQGSWRVEVRGQDGELIKTKYFKYGT